jgi:hypothetical protein
MNKLTYVVYSHSDFLDILEIQADHMSDIENKVLIINNFIIDDNAQKILDKFKKVYTYTDDQPYASRLLNTVSQIDSEYILFTHEIDILLQKDDVIINKFVELMYSANIARIDLQPNGGNSGLYIEIDKDKRIEDWYHVLPEALKDDKQYLCQHTDPATYIYNVNPSIWNRYVFLELFGTFPHRTYRDIEFDDVQRFCASKYRVYNLYSKNILHCGYLRCLPFYKYMHITHFTKLLRLHESFTDEFGQSYRDSAKEYMDIVNKYKLLSGKRPFTN